MAKPRPEKKRQKAKPTQPPLPGMPPPEPPGTIRVLPIQLRIGDQITDESGTWQVIARPYSSAGGKNTQVRVQRVDIPGATDTRLWRLWAQSGMRAGEGYGLQQHDINYDGGTELVRRAWSRQRLGPTKTNLEREPSFLHPIADDSPEWHPSRSSPAARSRVGMLKALPVQGLSPSDFVFTRPNGKPWSSDTVKRPWRRTLLAAGVRYREPEQLRHTFASTLLSRNAPPVYVQKQGGWRAPVSCCACTPAGCPRIWAPFNSAQPPRNRRPSMRLSRWRHSNITIGLRRLICDSST